MSSTNFTPRYLKVALSVPMRRLFDYRLPEGESATDWPAGIRVKVPFGKSHRIGLLVEHASSTEWQPEQVKPAQQRLDDQPLLPESLWQLSLWSAKYYQHALGDALLSTLPTKLREGGALSAGNIRQWRLTAAGQQTTPACLSRAKAQQHLLSLFQQEQALTDNAIAEQAGSRSALLAMEKKALIEAFSIASGDAKWGEKLQISSDTPVLNKEQAAAVAAIRGSQQQFQPFLLEGVTGSGKTEVYLQAMAPVLEAGKQVLMLVPEIGLTPQTLSRFQKRFNCPIAMLHSGLNDTERLDAWLQARDNRAGIVIGTRSAIFTPCHQLGMIIVDEEHDMSLKQQEGYRYHARDLAVARSQKEQLPLLLGSATPSLETLQNALHGRYQHLQLRSRAGNAQAVKHQLLDIKGRPLDQGFSPELLGLIKQHLHNDGQVLVFLNRRGYAPSLICHECGYLEECRRCDAYYTLHQRTGLLQCHHCGSQKPVPHQCPECGSTRLLGRGVGTEQLEQALQRHFPEHPCIRIDRDSTRRKGALDAFLGQIKRGEAKLLLGTQMLAKGHHFPEVTLVVIMDVDGALFSADFRAPERLGQLITQVAGRAGRAGKQGTLVMQTHHPEHILLQDLLQNGYGHFARTALSERKQAQLPPFRHLALFRAESHRSEDAEAFLMQLSALLQQKLIESAIELGAVLGPMPAPMERKAGRFRWQLLLESAERKTLHQWLHGILVQAEKLPISRKIRWSLDIDPQDLS
ncbi:primosomal protein N' [Corallincola luteus]|uniref:Replication restart protein PriA n=1 Tax=Corallincola luteus TaxID=1775177 RepID=A0ABY2ANA5_9GAMM|nr:primosomal protein N' [Corallincola luteus]TCI04487.1 primosomal protein N' [Corallincola luteus]